MCEVTNFSTSSSTLAVFHVFDKSHSTLNETSQTQKNKHCVVPLTQAPGRVRVLEMENRTEVPRAAGGAGVRIHGDGAPIKADEDVLERDGSEGHAAL